MGSIAADTIADLLSRGLSVLFVAEGDSMYPLIRSGDRLLVRPVAAGDVRCGEVVLSRTSRGLTAHRVIATTAAAAEIRILTRGDNLARPDDAFGEGELLGLVVEVERNGVTHRVRTASGAMLQILRLASRVRAAAVRRMRG